jgi:hypothetical protein
MEVSGSRTRLYTLPGPRESKATNVDTKLWPQIASDARVPQSGVGTKTEGVRMRLARGGATRRPTGPAWEHWEGFASYA